MTKTDESFKADPAAQTWSAVLSRCGAITTIDLDDVLAPFDAAMAGKPGNVVWHDCDGLSVASDASTVRPAIGVRIDNADAVDAALGARLAALAIEKDCEVIALTTSHISGLERYGFRTERLVAGHEEEMLEQLKRFWGLQIVL